MAWTNLTLTVDGRNALNQAQFDNQLNFKSIVVGDGTAPANFRTQKKLVHQLYELTDLKIDKTDSGCTLTADFPKVDYDYYFREVGIIVTTKEGDKLYVYDNCGEDAQYIVSSTGAETTQKRLRLALVISDVENITISEPSILYVSYDDYEQTILELNQTKVDKIEGKGLSTNDYTNADKNKLSGIAEGAEVNVQANWNVSDSNSDAYIKNKPQAMKNPTSLNISLNGISQGAYDGSSQKDVNITAQNVGADSSGTAATKVSEHNASEAAHADIRNLITTLTTRLNTLADSDDTTLDQLSEIVAYIKSNRSLIENITTKKVNVDDIIDNLTSNITNKPLSAQQGKVLKDLIDTLTSIVDGKANDFNGILTNATFQGTQATFLCPQQVKVSSGEAGKDGYIILARIKITSLYNGFPISINFSQRGWGDMRTLYIRFLDRGDTLDVGLSSFYIDRPIGDYIGIAKIDTATWNIYVRKSQGWSATCVHSFYFQSGTYEVIFPSEQVDTLPDGCVQPQVIKYQASEILDDGNDNAIKVSYSKDGLDSANWLAAWNNYELRAISPNNLRKTINAVNKSGDLMTGALGNSLITATFWEGNKGKAIINSTAPAGVYTMLDKLNSINGYFTDGVWEGKRIFNYTKKETVDSNGNTVTHSVTLLDEDGNSYFPNVIDMDICKVRQDVCMRYGRTNIHSYATPIAGGIILLDDLTQLSNHRGFSGSTSPDGNSNWNSVISVRHRNGYGDGNLYGMYLKCPFGQNEDNSNLSWRYQNTDWHNERILLDSYNYKRHCLPLDGGIMNDDSHLEMPCNGGIGGHFSIYDKANEYIFIMYPAYLSHEVKGTSSSLDLGQFGGSGIGNYGLKINYNQGDSIENYVAKLVGDSLQIYSLNYDSTTYYGSEEISCDAQDGIFIKINNSSSPTYFNFDRTYFVTSSSGIVDLGTNNHKWKNIYAQNGTIQTSDRTQKTNVANLEIELTKKFIMGLIPCSYKMIKGTSGRTHYGFIAQDIEELMNTLNMDSSDFAGFIKSPKKIIKYEDENGKKLKNPIEEVIEGEYDYALRYDEFIAPLIKVVQEQQKMIEQQQRMIEQQQIAIENQQKEIEQIKKEISKIYSQT